MWEIGILAADLPLQWGSGGLARNPVLTAGDIVDVRAAFVADPFMILRKGVWYLFFEVLRDYTRTGQIGLAVSEDLVRWLYQKIVLRESFHLSYPHVFEWEGSYYMVPETIGAGEVRLYKSINFPFDWKVVGSLVQGLYADPSIFRWGGTWWMFACDTPFKHRSLRLFHGRHLEGPWVEHHRGPIVQDNARIARPAGRVLAFDGRLIRFAQDCSTRYGRQVWAFEITRLDQENYSERPASVKPIIGTGTKGYWRTSRMHHIDVHAGPSGGWIACVDGWTLHGNDVE